MYGPRGGREEFQSTLPVWGVTSLASVALGVHGFQSTLPVWGVTAKMHKISFYILGKYVNSAK